MLRSSVGDKLAPIPPVRAPFTLRIAGELATRSTSEAPRSIASVKNWSSSLVSSALDSLAARFTCSTSRVNSPSYSLMGKEKNELRTLPGVSRLTMLPHSKLALRPQEQKSLRRAALLQFPHCAKFHFHLL